jgi:peptidyl-tRNA hydrolase
MLKQYVIVPKRPRMSAGKIASQVAHATYIALEKERKTNGYRLIDKWIPGMCVIVLECKNTEQLMSAAQYMSQWHIIHYLYIDEGYSEVDPLTPTALATGIITDDKQWMFENFRLYTDKRR